MAAVITVPAVVMSEIRIASDMDPSLENGKAEDKLARAARLSTRFERFEKNQTP